jgi:FlaA1/EpsC-like NDP-sugar epimerase
LRARFSRSTRARLLLFERYENGLFAIAGELAAKDGNGRIVPLIGDVTDWNRVTAVISDHRPHIVFHAAAHKHVPLMEQNPCEAVKNNVAGTWVVARVAARWAWTASCSSPRTRPSTLTSVMGATKRVCETIVQALSNGGQPGGLVRRSLREGGTRFTAVRFGNVLASSGSVVPTFQAQIAAGGPVTVTHPDVTRYFMLIPEAVQLVLHAAALAEGGEVFVLEMGEPIRVADLARNLIRLSGYVPDRDIPIRFVGLRPGEKRRRPHRAGRLGDPPPARARGLHQRPHRHPRAARPARPGGGQLLVPANRPEYVFLVAGTVGGILANSTRPAEFIYDNMMIHATVVHAAHLTA